VFAGHWCSCHVPNRRGSLRGDEFVVVGVVMTQPWAGEPIAVVGIGADGWDGLGRVGQEAIRAADVLFGSARQLALVPDGDAERVAWPSPLVLALPGLFERYAGRRLAVLASGDPMFYGIGVTLAGLFGAGALRVLPQSSSVSLACARLGWALAEVPIVSAVGRPVETVLPELADRRCRLLLAAGRRPGHPGSGVSGKR
jgi:precorrin-6B C5,15-methyltransferase / cobalt-precorrin-6B C5,C15-methyltransferase